MWGNFDDSLATNPYTVSKEERDGVVIERVFFDGRDTGEGRVRIFAAYAYDAKNAERETVLILPDSTRTVDEELLTIFVRHGYSAFMVDYRGEWEGEQRTYYPNNVAYANLKTCGRTKDFVDDSADRTCWYEWVAVGLYARKYIAERSGSDAIAVVGLRDGGEIAWKLGSVRKFSCIVPVCAAGWKAYDGISKYLPDEPQLNDERYRFIAGIDSQAYATTVKCPVLMLCSTNDARFDYDRAHDTFSRINPEYIGDSVIAYSVSGNSTIDGASVQNMLMFLDKNLKKRHVFLPRPVELTVTADENENLVASVAYDEEGIAEAASVYLAEDCIDSVQREWDVCPRIGGRQDAFYLNIYEKTATVFVLASVRYTNGFTAWSKIVVKKISGRFRNMQSRCNVMYSERQGAAGFFMAEPDGAVLGGVFLKGNEGVPHVVPKAKGVSGLYSPYGITTYRMNHPRFAPSAGSVLKLDVFCDESSEIVLSLVNLTTREEYFCTAEVVGGVWQSVIAESKNFKSVNGVPLASFTDPFRFTIKCGAGYAVNNVMWL